MRPIDESINYLFFRPIDETSIWLAQKKVPKWLALVSGKAWVPKPAVCPSDRFILSHIHLWQAQEGQTGGASDQAQRSFMRVARFEAETWYRASSFASGRGGAFEGLRLEAAAGRSEASEAGVSESEPNQNGGHDPKDGHDISFKGSERDFRKGRVETSWVWKSSKQPVLAQGHLRSSLFTDPESKSGHCPGKKRS